MPKVIFSQKMNIPRFLYHATYGVWVDDIKSKGLLPSGTICNWGKCEPGVYLADNANLAYSFPESADDSPVFEEDPDANIVVFKIDTSKLDRKLFDLDTHCDWVDGIPPSAIVQIKESKNYFNINKISQNLSYIDIGYYLNKENIDELQSEICWLTDDFKLHIDNALDKKQYYNDHTIEDNWLAKGRIDYKRRKASLNILVDLGQIGERSLLNRIISLLRKDRDLSVFEFIFFDRGFVEKIAQAYDSYLSIGHDDIGNTFLWVFNNNQIKIVPYDNHDLTHYDAFGDDFDFDNYLYGGRYDPVDGLITVSMHPRVEGRDLPVWLLTAFRRNFPDYKNIFIFETVGMRKYKG